MPRSEDGARPKLRYLKGPHAASNIPGCPPCVPPTVVPNLPFQRIPHCQAVIAVIISWQVLNPSLHEVIGEVEAVVGHL